MAKRKRTRERQAQKRRTFGRIENQMCLPYNTIVTHNRSSSSSIHTIVPNIFPSVVAPHRALCRLNALAEDAFNGMFLLLLLSALLCVLHTYSSSSDCLAPVWIFISYAMRISHENKALCLHLGLGLWPAKAKQ